MECARHSLKQLYQSLIRPYLNFGICVWGQANDTNFKKILILQKRALRIIYLAKYRDHAIPLFLESKILPIKCLYFEHLASVMYDVSNKLVPDKVLNLFTKTSDIHNYSTRVVTSKNFYLKYSNLEIQRNSFSRIGTSVWNCIPQSIRTSHFNIFV